MACLILLLLIVVALLATSNRHQVLIAFDQLINARLGGWADETMSARCWRLRGLRRRYAVMVKVINAVFFWQENHCLRS